MPRIPENPRSGLSLDVPGASVSIGGSSAVGEGVARLGAAIEGISLDLAEKIKRAEAQTAVSTNILDDQIAADNYMDELKLKHPSGYVTENGVMKKDEKGNPVSVSSAFQQWANKRYHDKQAAMPSDLAQKVYQEQAANLFTEKFIKIRGDERVLKFETFKKQHQSNIEKAAADQLTRPDIGSAYAATQRSKFAVLENVGYIYTENTAKSMIEEQNDMIAFNHFDGSLNYALAQKKVVGKRTEDANRILNILLGKSENSYIADMLTPEHRSMLTKRAIEAAKTARDLDKSEAEAGFRNREAGLKSGEGDRKRLLADGLAYAKVLATDEKTGKIRPEILTEHQTKLATAVSVGVLTNDPEFEFSDKATKQSMLNNSRMNAREIAKSYGIPGAGELPVAQLNDAITTKIDEQARAQQNDPVRYVLNSRYKNSGQFTQVGAIDAAIRSGDIAGTFSKLPTGAGVEAVRVAKLYSGKAGLSGGEARVISKEASEALGRMKDSKDVEKTNSDVLAMRAAFGPHYKEVIMQAIKDGNLPEGWIFSALFSENPMENKDIIALLIGGKKVWEYFQATTSKKVSEQQLSQLRSTIESELRPIAVSMLKGNVKSVVNDEMVADLMHLFVTDSIRRLNSMNDPDAEKAARQSIVRFKSRWVQVPGTEMFLSRDYATSSGARARITDDDSNNIAMFLNTFRQNMKPEDYRPMDGSSLGFDRQLKRSEWVFTQREGQWGVALMIPGNFAGVEGVEQMPVLKKDGTPLFFPINELPSLGVKARINQQNSKTLGTPSGKVLF